MLREVVETWEDPAEDIEARPLAPAVGFTRALGHTSTFQGEPDETGHDIAHYQQLEEFHGSRIPLVGQPQVPRAITSFVTEVKRGERFGCGRVGLVVPTGFEPVSPP
jgi:hypothetical protein